MISPKRRKANRPLRPQEARSIFLAVPGNNAVPGDDVRARRSHACNEIRAKYAYTVARRWHPAMVRPRPCFLRNGGHGAGPFIGPARQERRTHRYQKLAPATVVATRTICSEGDPAAIVLHGVAGDGDGQRPALLRGVRDQRSAGNEDEAFVRDSVISWST